jgi:DMSO/TMAO reductase YedYZ heme-binding membrane subunit
MPDTPNDLAALGPSPAESRRFRLAQLIVTTNVVLAGLLSVLSFAGVVEVTGISAYLGTFFLIGALVPSNLLRFERYASGRRTRTLARLRKPLGISAGIWFVAHSVMSVWELFDLSLPLLPQFTRTGIVLGLLATVVFSRCSPPLPTRRSGRLAGTGNGCTG